MRTHFTILLLLGIHAAGCVRSPALAFHHPLPLREALQRVHHGQPILENTHYDFATGVTETSTWENATGVTEWAGVLLDENNLVSGTKYQVRGEEWKLALLMYIRRDRTEWAILSPGAMTVDEQREHVAQTVVRLAHVGNGHDPREFLDRAWKARRRGKRMYRRVYDLCTPGNCPAGLWTQFNPEITGFQESSSGVPAASSWGLVALTLLGMCGATVVLLRNRDRLAHVG